MSWPWSGVSAFVNDPYTRAAADAAAAVAPLGRTAATYGWAAQPLRDAMRDYDLEQAQATRPSAVSSLFGIFDGVTTSLSNRVAGAAQAGVQTARNLPNAGGRFVGNVVGDVVGGAVSGALGIDKKTLLIGAAVVGALFLLK